MESFKQLLGYVRKDFGLEDTEDIIEVNSEFIKIFHKEFNKYQEKMQESLDFLDSDEFVHTTPISKWFKKFKGVEAIEEVIAVEVEGEEGTVVESVKGVEAVEGKEGHPNYQKCCNNLYALVCISQDILGNEMIKNFGNISGDNIHEQIQNMFSEDSPLSGLLENSPLADLLKNESIKPMLDNLLTKLKDLDIEKMMADFQSGNFDMGNVQELLGGFMGGANNPGLNNVMNLLGPMMGGLGGGDEMAGLSPQQRAKARREKKTTEYRRKVRAREKAKRKKRGNKKKRG